jgi:hypothetical protein
MFINELFAPIDRCGSDGLFGGARLPDWPHGNRAGCRIDFALIGQADVGRGFSPSFGHEISKIAGLGKFP